MKQKWTLNAGTGMVLGIVIAALMSIVINLLTGSSSIWLWSIPFGLAVGLAIGAGYQANHEKTEKL
ncbi:MAG: hypothetical protein R3E31_21065 [Chloroflexota bacterium]|nr:hypothetical protein [Anaerolineales bacterium]MCB8967291.1 hypothetical protein [Ardenticatenaceae bacterium]